MTVFTFFSALVDLIPSFVFADNLGPETSFVIIKYETSVFFVFHLLFDKRKKKGILKIIGVR